MVNINERTLCQPSDHVLNRYWCNISRVILKMIGTLTFKALYYAQHNCLKLQQNLLYIADHLGSLNEPVFLNTVSLGWDKGNCNRPPFAWDYVINLLACYRIYSKALQSSLEFSDKWDQLISNVYKNIAKLPRTNGCIMLEGHVMEIFVKWLLIHFNQAGLVQINL